MVSLKHYAGLTLVLTASALYYAWSTRKNFYNSAIFMTNHKINIVILGNLSFLLLVLFGRMLKRVFLGTLSRDEVEELVTNSKYAITETCLAMTIFREEINLRLLVLFSALLFVKIFHWLVHMRVESVGRVLDMPRLAHARLVALMSLLGAIDAAFVIVIGVQLLRLRQASVLLLFGFEYLILTISLLTVFVKYLVYVLDGWLEARRGAAWAHRTAALFYLEFTGDLVRLCLYLVFFLVICTYYGLPLHFIRELGMTLYSLREKIVKFVQFRRITKNMRERFADATAADLTAPGVDRTCIVCREDMDPALAAGGAGGGGGNQSSKKLPCGHMFHFVCLRTWLERSQSCPTCRAEIPVDAPAQNQHQPRPNNPNANQGVAAVPAGGAPAAAAVAAPAVAGAAGATSGGSAPAATAAPNGLSLPPLPAGISPLPPHIQMHLDALRLAAAQAQHELAAAAAPVAPMPSAPVVSVPAASSLLNGNNLVSPLHPLFGSPSPAAAQASPSPHHPLLSQLGAPAPASAFPFAAPSPASLFGAPMVLPSPFMFPPPPMPPPPPHLFTATSLPHTLSPLNGLPHSLASASAVTAPTVAAPPGFSSPALYAAYLSHQTMLLQHHLDFLESSRAQVTILLEQQRAQEKAWADKLHARPSDDPSKPQGKSEPPASVGAEDGSVDIKKEEAADASALHQRSAALRSAPTDSQ